MKKGHAATLEPGDDLNLSLDADLLMPAAVEPHAKAAIANLPGLKVTVKKTKLINDGLDGHLLRMDVDIVNDSERVLKSIDLFLEDSNGNKYPVCGGPDEESEFIFDVEPHGEKNTRLYFQVAWPKAEADACLAKSQ